MKGFLEFIREQGVIGLAVGFILGGAISKLVTSVVTDLVNPLIGLALGATNNLANYYTPVGDTRITWGVFLVSLIDFIVIALVVYIGVKVLKLDKLDKPKAPAK